MLAPNHKRILRNTALLYMRMLLAMAVTLYTSRIVLDVLGVEDFGTYHVVAGFVAMLGFLHGAMTSATQRYFAFDLGESAGSQLNQIFNTSFMIHGLLALVIAGVAETAGYWFVATQLTIPTERIDAAMWAYHMSVASFALSVMMVPFTALLMAHERMGIFAGISMLDVMLKLAAVIALQYVGTDKLIAYAALLLSVCFITIVLYAGYCTKAFGNIRLAWCWNPEQFRSMLAYTAWNTWGNLAAALSGQGSNVLLNMFFGPAVNAGRAVAFQANTALNSFVQNLQAAVNPQIIKLYASGDLKQMHGLVLHAAKYNFFLLFTFALPVLLQTEALLGLWLVEIPPYATIFLQLIIINSLIDSFSGPLMTSAQATGHIRLYQAVVGGLLLLNLPISYLFLKQGQPPEIVMLVSIGMGILALACRLAIITPLIKLSSLSFVSVALARSAAVAATAGPCGFLLATLWPATFIGLLISIPANIIVVFLSVWLVGLTEGERAYLLNTLIHLRNKVSRA